MIQFDFLTIALSSVIIPWLTSFSVLIDHDILFGILLIFITIIGERRSEKLKKIFLAVLLAFIAASVLKNAFQIERPCTIIQSKIPCPDSYSFPSIHATLAFILPFAFLRNRLYPFYLSFALFIGFTRIYLLVHSFIDIVGGLVIAALVYYAVDLVYSKKRR